MSTKTNTKGKVRLVLSVNPETVKQLKILAATAETTMSNLFESLINTAGRNK